MDLIVTNDRSKGLINSVATILPQSHHRYCGLHLLESIKEGRLLTWANCNCGH